MMSYKSILLYADRSPGGAASRALAFDLAERFGAHLTALVLGIEPSVPTYGCHPVLLDALEVQRQAALDDAQDLAGEIGRAMEREGLIVDCRVEPCLAPACADVVSRHTRYSDLLVMAQPDPDEPGLAGRHLPEHVVLGCGRPVLIVPYIGVRGNVGKRVAVTWNASREAGRAMQDALPFLSRADELSLLIVKPDSASADHGEDPGSDIALYLARHECKVNVRTIKATELPPEEAILSSLADFGADMLVMGAYGHARLRELALGGVTQHILEHMTVPVLMSH